MNEACCACMTVMYQPEDLAGGSMRSRWLCRDCGRAFVTKMTPPDPMTRAFQKHAEGEPLTPYESSLMFNNDPAQEPDSIVMQHKPGDVITIHDGNKGASMRTIEIPYAPGESVTIRELDFSAHVEEVSLRNCGPSLKDVLPLFRVVWWQDCKRMSEWMSAAELSEPKR